jgi:uncharacterized Zn-binding protein involved in type VI secretion
MFPAARIGDPVTHDLTSPAGAIGPPITPPKGKPVIIEGMPAAYVTCTVVCSGATSAGPAHPPPGAGAPPVPITLGSPTVLINGLPAARWVPSGDFAGCMAQFGTPPMAASRSVLVGGLTAPANIPFALGTEGILLFGSAIQIEGDETFKSRVANRLLKISSTATGVTLVASLEASGKQVIIREAVGNEGSYQAPVDEVAATKAGGQIFDGSGSPVFDAQGQPLVGSGAGSSSVIGLDPSDRIENPHAPEESIGNDAVLMHELIHADHAAQGTQDCSPNDTYDTEEERETINGGPPSETSYLRERGHKWHRVDHAETLAPMPKP